MEAPLTTTVASSSCVSSHGAPSSSASSTIFLFVFSSAMGDFRLDEILSLAQGEGISNLRWKLEDPQRLLLHQTKGQARSKQDYEKLSPFLLVELPNETVAKRIASRSVTLKEVVELWGCGKTYADAVKASQQYPEHLRKPYLAAGTTFKVEMFTFGRSISDSAQKELLDHLIPLDFQGKAQMKNPQIVFSLCTDYGHNSFVPEPQMVYFGRRICLGHRDLLDTYSLKKRMYLGTTSMAAELSFLVANQAKARPGMFIFDPFVGTGSILVSCAAMGAYVCGGDIDPRVLRGTGKKHNLLANFRQYKLMDRFVDIVINDQASCALRRNRPLFDAIVCDPPYGIRAGAKKVGKKEKHADKKIPVETLKTHIPTCVPYDVPDVLTDLLHFSAQMIRLGGRLVYWLPTTDEYREEHVPSHPCFVLVANSEQVMTWHWRRRLVTMEKVVEYDETKHANLPKIKYNIVVPESSDEEEAKEEIETNNDKATKKGKKKQSKDSEPQQSHLPAHANLHEKIFKGKKFKKPEKPTDGTPSPSASTSSSSAVTDVSMSATSNKTEQ